LHTDIADVMTTEYQSVAVVDAAEDRTIVWQVDVSAEVEMTRMCGAWVIESTDSDTLTNLTQDRYVVATPAGAKACDRADARTHRGVIDLDRVVNAITSEIHRLQTVFDTASARSKSKLITPSWPRIPAVLDLENPPRDSNAPDDVAIALAIARWLEAVALAWESVEQQRMARKHLRGKATNRRPLPISLQG
jgi:hypothetical protein